MVTLERSEQNVLQHCFFDLKVVQKCLATNVQNDQHLRNVLITYRVIFFYHIFTSVKQLD